MWLIADNLYTMTTLEKMIKEKRIEWMCQLSLEEFEEYNKLERSFAKYKARR